MLILRSDNQVFVAPGDMTVEQAEAMIANGQAVAVTRLRVNHDIRYTSADVNFSIDASPSYDRPVIARVPEDIPEHLAKEILKGQKFQLAHFGRHQVEIVG